MSKTMWSIGLLALLCLCCHLTYGDEVTDDVCGNTTLTDSSGQINVSDLPVGKKCTYNIIAANYTPQVALKFNKIMLDPLVFNLTVYGGSTNGTVIANLTQGCQDVPYSLVVSRFNVTVVVFSRTATNTTVSSSGFSASFDHTKCEVSESSLGGAINSPIYLPGNGSVSCVYNETNIVPGYMTVLSFLDFNVTKGTVNVTMGTNTKSFSGSQRPGDSFGAAGVTNLLLNVTYNNDTVPQTFTALYQTVDPACSGNFTATKASSALSVPNHNQLPMKCYMQIVADDSKVYVTGTGASSVSSRLDSFVFYDGDSAQGTILGTLTEGQNWFVSSGKSMTVVANLGAQTNRTSSLQYRSDKFSMFYWLSNVSTVVALDGNFVENDMVMLQFVSKNDSAPLVRLEVLSNSTITDAVVTFLCQDGNDVFNFIKSSVLFPVVMQSTRAMVMIKGLGKDQTVNIRATAVSNTDCNVILAGQSGQIQVASTNQTMCNQVIVPAGDLILDLTSVDLCKTGKLVIYDGVLQTSKAVATLTAGNKYLVIPQLKFSSGSTPRLVWSDANNTMCSGPSVLGRFWTQDNDATCGSLGSGLNGTILTPNYPNQYPLNVKCNWTLPSANASMMFLSVQTMEFNPQQNITLQNSSTGAVLSVYNGTTLPNDLLIPNRNLSVVFSSQQAMDGDQLPQAAQGAKIIYKVLTCGGLVNSTSGNISIPQLKNQSTECIWIIQVPANGTKQSVNIVSANFTVFGYNNTNNGTLEVFDGASIRNQKMIVNMTAKNATNLKSRLNVMIVRYSYTNSTSGPFGVNISYVAFNCNSSMQCDGGICIHPEWICDGLPQCADGKDERHCNGSRPIPPTPTTTVAPSPHTDGGKKGGVAGYWVFITLVIGMVLGVILTVAVPQCIRKFRQRNMSRSNNYGSLHEDT